MDVIVEFTFIHKFKKTFIIVLKKYRANHQKVSDLPRKFQFRFSDLFFLRW